MTIALHWALRGCAGRIIVNSIQNFPQPVPYEGFHRRHSGYRPPILCRWIYLDLQNCREVDMSGKQSIDMAKAERLVKGGTPPPDAARKAGVAVQSIYRAPWYRSLKGLPPVTKQETKRK